MQSPSTRWTTDQWSLLTLTELLLNFVFANALSNFDRRRHCRTLTNRILIFTVMSFFKEPHICFLRCLKVTHRCLKQPYRKGAFKALERTKGTPDPVSPKRRPNQPMTKSSPLDKRAVRTLSTFLQVKIVRRWRAEYLRRRRHETASKCEKAEYDRTMCVRRVSKCEMCLCKFTLYACSKADWIPQSGCMEPKRRHAPNLAIHP